MGDRESIRRAERSRERTLRREVPHSVHLGKPGAGIGNLGRRRMDWSEPDWPLGRMVMRPSDREIVSQWDNVIPYDRNQPN